MTISPYEHLLQHKPAPKIVVLTGAGISAESGIKTFRDNNGLWENHRVEEVATPEGFAANPDLVYRFYNERRQQLLNGEVQANAAHFALAKLEERLGNDLCIVTQNVDNLHELSGCRNVIHMHGSLLSAKCVRSDKAVEWLSNLDDSDRCMCCEPSQAMRPDIVWFNEIPYSMMSIEKRLQDCDLFVSIGTSGNVYPAAGFVNFARQSGAHTIELNLEPSQGQSLFDECYHDAASRLVPEFVENCLRAMN